MNEAGVTDIRGHRWVYSADHHCRPGPSDGLGRYNALTGIRGIQTAPAEWVKNAPWGIEYQI